ncbi:ATP-binding protein [Paludisphaera rhizosphaerae]|uniref:ATP-binding protein n=1 Tax=Paludisphaera rhizosphaerae TaxID=2711216 RepID=UPI0013EBBBE2|nr:ATP-binding protein [Paludisphaera rhizosphaerae]
MDRNRQMTPQEVAPGSRAGSRPGSWNAAVASRRSALESLATALTGGPEAGPVLLTGEPGAGKTWTRRRLAEGLPAGWRAAVVEVSPSLDAVDFLTLAAAKLGVAPLPERPSTLRLAVARVLEDDARDGRSWLLVVEDALHAGPDVWAEVETLCDNLGQPGGFAGALIVGRTELVRRMSAQPMRAVAARLSKHLHLPPLDVEEASRLLGVEGEELELLHRDAVGNPRRLLALAAARPVEPVPVRLRPLVEAPKAEAAPPHPDVPVVRPVASPPATAFPNGKPPRAETVVEVRPIVAPASLLPSKPPLRVEDGLIEVGWAGGLDDGEETVHDFGAMTASTPADGELIEDHYAALQAWSEWARNRDRLTQPAQEAAVEDEIEADGEEAVAETVEEAEDESILGGDVRAEAPHDHAPYSQLFTKLRQSS